MSEESFVAPEPHELGQVLPAYEFESFIAQGGMGAVYKATQRSLDREVAIKVLPRELGSDPEFQQSFVTEAKAMARLNHPNLISVYDYGEIEGMPYIVMEYVPGKSLYHSAYGQAVEAETSARIVKGILDGLAHAHDNGIIHRDIKPANILLTPNAQPKIGDFGLAHHAESGSDAPIMGTPGYVAPEVFSGESYDGGLADLFSVGVILHQLLTGIDPSGSEGPPTQLSGRVKLDAVWRKATQVDPAQRYATAHEMGADLDRWLSIPKKTAGVPTRNTAPVRVQTLKSAKSGGTGVATALFLVLLAAVAYFGYRWYQQQQGDTKPDTEEVESTEPDETADPSALPAGLETEAPEP